jgi:hypothetical protein
LPGRTWTTGPVVDLTLHSDDARIAPVTLDGIIDTGASAICVDSRITKQLGLVARDRKPMEMADGRVTECGVYPTRMVIPDLGFDGYVPVCAIDMVYASRRVLLGRSFLRDYIVNYEGPRERFQFHETDRGDEFFVDHDE